MLSNMFSQYVEPFAIVKELHQYGDVIKQTYVNPTRYTTNEVNMRVRRLLYLYKACPNRIATEHIIMLEDANKSKFYLQINRSGSVIHSTLPNHLLVKFLSVE